MRRATLACASALLLVGFTAGCGDDATDDASSKESTSTAPSDSPSDSPSAEPSDSPSEPASASEGAGVATPDYCAAAKSASDSEEIDDLRVAVADLVETLPDSANAQVTSGLDFLQTVLKSANNQSEFVDKVQAATGADRKAVTAYGAFEATTCPGPAPSASAPAAPES